MKIIICGNWLPHLKMQSHIVYLEEKIKLYTKITETKKDSKKSLEKSNEEQNIIFWNLKVGEIKLLSGIKQGRVTCLEWSPSGKILAAGYNNGKICLWNLEENNHVFIENDQFPISKLVWSPKDKIIISVLNNNKVKVWDSEFSSEINLF
ncbi:WD40 repeat domain-containing protein [Nostoc sp.]|uniref:WD40 repeat domain-containing protein n=1 Tax=Nostoc sp. TaxID=1180 RepID=UPI002FEF829B